MSTTDAQHYFNFAGPSVASEVNQNLSRAQKELLMWHLRTGYSMYHLQQLMKPQTFKNEDGSKRVLPPIIKVKQAW